MTPSLRMPELQVKKVVAVCFWESAKLTLEHIGEHRLRLSQAGSTGSDELPRIYGDLRRLRDYLQRSVSVYQDVVVLELSDEDAALLVACCRRSVEALEYRLTDGVVLQDERQWMIKKCRVLSDWAVEMAAKPLLELPLSRLGAVTGEVERALTTRLHQKVFGSVEGRKKYCQPQSRQHSKSQGIATFGEYLVGDPPADDPYEKAAAERPGVDLAAEDDSDEDPLPLTLGLSSISSRATTSANAALPRLFDCGKVRDPRLRALVGVDMNAFDRCFRDGDYRLATVLLAAIMETAVLDHVIPRRTELALTGAPDTWSMRDVLMKAMGEAAEPRDRALSFHLFASRSLLRPALQMVTPAVVTAASFERLHEFAGRALHVLGFGAPAKTVSHDSAHVEDLLH